MALFGLGGEDMSIAASKKDPSGSGGYRRIAIKCFISPFSTTPHRHANAIKAADEYWAVAYYVPPNETFQPYTAVYTIEQLEAVLSAKKVGRTKIAKAVSANANQITITATALALLIDDKIAALEAERPNSDDTQVHRDQALSEYQMLRAKLTQLQAAIANFLADKSKETALSKDVKSFKSGVRDWWTKSSDTICSKAYDAGVFALLVSICSMAGASGSTAVIASAALAGGKPVIEVLKNLARKL